MAESMDAIITIILVGYLWLAATGKVRLNKDPEKNDAAVKKMAPVKFLAPIAIIAAVLLLLSRLAR